MKKKLKKIMKSKSFPVYVILGIVIIICLLIICSMFFGNGSKTKYGNRLSGIKDVPFNKNSQNKVIEKINSNEKMSDAKIKIHGKIINIIYDVEEDVSSDDAKRVANESLGEISNKVKKFYDIEVLITKKKEKGEEIQSEEGTTEVKKEFPIIGYKNINQNEFVW